MGYGLLVRHLHTDRKVANFQVEGIIKPRNDWRYLLFWGLSGVVLGGMLPWVDTLFSGNEDTKVVEKKNGEKDEGVWADWTPVVRSVGAFVGIAYAIVRVSIPFALPAQPSLLLKQVLMNIAAQTPMVLTPASLPYSRPREPRSLVPH
jgi:hypothetical protein